MSLEQTGLSVRLLAELFAKHLQDTGAMSAKQLIQKVALAGPVIDTVIGFMRQERLVEVCAPDMAEGRELGYRLTQLGHGFALDATARSGYLGPAPVPLERYREVIAAQSVHQFKVNRDQMERGLVNVTLRREMKEQLGPALNSGRAIFIYGPAGTGKTYITQKLATMFDDNCLVPYAVAIDEQVMSVFDPLVHRLLDKEVSSPSVLLDEGFDPRFALCHRPVVITGGELGMEMLEVQTNSVTREYEAPLQVKANNGVFIIDDMGRQRASPMQIFNRWIVPLEEQVDYLTLRSGKHFSVPFDQVLIFSTNMNPMDLADEAFLRRIGHKIYFGYLNADEYSQIWKQVCIEKQISFDPALLNYVLNHLHQGHKIPLRPCHPRDLLGLALDRMQYEGGEQELTSQHLDWAWGSYFVSLKAELEMSVNHMQNGGGSDGHS
ncbi:AAA family ATPase [Marinobacterium arenosum]|uniref:AAA family ATPase n=1 Tax=Marinobacterium arenosum TaxID=2862496 RepID=UPI0021062AD1|nr:AAA family ATPase [Marinobacterium arenosum]